ncbi:hypothetical protein POW16_29780, partial [Raoultella planticola]
MAVPVHLILKDDGGSQIVGSCDVHGRDGSIELRSLQHGVIIPTDPLTGKVTGSRQHCSFKEGANKQVISSQADSLIKISRIWAD